MDWLRIRDDFPILKQEVDGHPLIYLDSAASSQKPRAVIDALTRYYERDNANVHRALHALSMRATDAFEAARRTTEGVNLVAYAWCGANLKPGDVILTTGMEHHSDLVPWQLAAQRTGATLKHIPVLDDGTLDQDAFEKLLTPEVKLLALVHISNSLGTINPVREMCAKAKALGATTFVDAAQSAGHIPVSVQDIGCDFLAFSGHKVCAPTGIGVLYGRMAILEAMPPWHGGGEMILTVTLDTCTYKPPPARFEAGTPDIAGAIGLAAAIDYLEAIGLPNIEQHGLQLAQHALEKLSTIEGLRILGPQTGPRGSLVSFHCDFAHPHDIVEWANTYGIAMRGGHHCTQPLMKRFKVPGSTRASFYLYNTTQEIDRLAEVLDSARRFFS
jgi:cysteine desulfurase/selenocysteine lyase